ncbi:MAG: ESX secretion-associated protein EspG [Mycobacteriaceae bacterium]|nr:ESX secretion-associated protein EspG [Mycobacteriaceae bacterium]
MTSTWRLGDLEFVAAWEAMGEDLLPQPLFYRSRTESYEDAQREQRQALADYHARADERLAAALRAIARPDLKVEVSAENFSDLDDPKGPVRLLAARLGDNGYVVTQLPGETSRHSGGFTISECGALELAGVAVRGLPLVGAGRKPEIVLPSDGVDHHPAVRARAAGFRQAPVTHVGFIDVVQGSSAFGPRGITQRRIRWRDLVGDGRYVITGNPAIAVGANTSAMVAAVNNAIAHVVSAIRDERYGSD